MTIATAILEKYKNEFLFQLNEICITFRLIGSGDFESPKWIQYRGIDENDREWIRFVNSQSSSLWFAIKIDPDDAEFFFFSDQTPIYIYFKTLKYDFIKEYHPTINTKTTPG